jgi:hypothetical protein
MVWKLGSFIAVCDLEDLLIFELAIEAHWASYTS